ncbi:uncharacterized protein LOC142343972 isoform X2 [Convolutriloba macropyga]|uniref:uncharacterized protein LOC142343972 isoform X2 n=1 Tax=Convolutriloba macropyga TaxID=536237 RepID=UPI003F524198
MPLRVICLAVALMLLRRTLQIGGQENCPNGATFLEGAGDYCYVHLIKEGVVARSEAAITCYDTFKGQLVDVKNKTQLGIVLDWAIKQGLPTNNQSGFWTYYKRDDPIPPGPNAQKLRRTAPFYGEKGPIPEILWRNESQPGNVLDDDERDEMCTAQSRPGRQPEFLGIDDYECDGKRSSW